MPLRDFQCIRGHIIEKILLGEEDRILQYIRCPQCQRWAKRKTDVPLVARRNPEHGIQK